MFLIIFVERLLYIGSHFSLRKRRWRPHFPTKLAAVASFSYKIGGGGLIFLQTWRRRQGFGNITGGCSDMVWILVLSPIRLAIKALLSNLAHKHINARLRILLCNLGQLKTWILFPFIYHTNLKLRKVHSMYNLVVLQMKLLNFLN